MLNSVLLNLQIPFWDGIAFLYVLFNIYGLKTVPVTSGYLNINRYRLASRLD